MYRRMSRPLSLGTWFGLKITISLLSLLSYLAAALGIAALAKMWLSLSLIEAVLAGVLSALSMFVGEMLHQLGHAWAARQTGYPMSGIHNFSLFSACLYPSDEPALPPSLHIRRALGGFWINLLIGLLLGAAAVNLWPAGGLWGWVTAFNAIWNFFVLGLGALLPIDIPGVFTIDGGTILRQWRESRHLKYGRQ